MKPEEDIKYDSDFIIDIMPNYVQGRRRGYTDEDTSLIANEVFEEMKKALEKQIPKKPIPLINIDGDIDLCNECESDLSPDDEYCHECGTKIDWGDEE